MKPISGGPNGSVSRAFGRRYGSPEFEFWLTYCSGGFESHLISRILRLDGSQTVSVSADVTVKSSLVVTHSTAENKQLPAPAIRTIEAVKGEASRDDLESKTNM